MAEDHATIMSFLSRMARHSLLNKVTFSSINDPETINLAFSFSGEDLVLRKIFKQQLISGKPGFYVDIGAADPRVGSNTFLLHCYGWRGVCIDANPRFAKLFSQTRPRDTFVNAAIGQTTGILYHAEYKGNIGMARVKSDPNEFGADFHSPVQVPMRTLRDILDATVPPETDIEVMSIDIEGTELTALESNNWEKYKPQVIVIEAQGLDPLQPLQYATIAYLVQQGYSFSMAICGSVILKSQNAP